MIYDSVYNAIKKYDATVDVTGVYPNSEPTKPCVYVAEIGRQQTVRFSTLVNDDDQYTSTYEVQVFVTGDRAKTKANALLDVAISAFKALGYRLDSYTSFPDGTTYRVAARLHRVTGGGDTL